MSSLPSSVAPVANSDVAGSAPGPGGGNSSGRVDTLMPVPITTASPAASARMPASLPPDVGVPSAGPPTAGVKMPGTGTASTSLGHLSVASTPVTSRIAVTTATPVSSGSQPHRAGGTRTGRSSRENMRAACGGETQARPIRPRPAVCSSAASTSPSAAPSCARTSRSALVDPVLATDSTVCQNPPLATAATSSALRPARASAAWSCIRSSVPISTKYRSCARAVNFLGFSKEISGGVVDRDQHQP
jgi:hypothetical protein